MSGDGAGPGGVALAVALGLGPRLRLTGVRLSYVDRCGCAICVVHTAKNPSGSNTPPGGMCYRARAHNCQLYLKLYSSVSQ